jgi:hypothetical protein
VHDKTTTCKKRNKTPKYVWERTYSLVYVYSRLSGRMQNFNNAITCYCYFSLFTGPLSLNFHKIQKIRHMLTHM